MSEWTSNNPDAWIWHGLNPNDSEKIIQEINKLNETGNWKSFGYANPVHLSEDSDTPLEIKSDMHLTGGSKSIVEHFKEQEEISLSHVSINFHPNTDRPSKELMHQFIEKLPHISNSYGGNNQNMLLTFTSMGIVTINLFNGGYHMDLKKYLLAGGLSSILVLGACGGDSQEEPQEEPQETGGTEESSEAEDEQSSDSPGDTIVESGESLDEDEEPEDSEVSEE